MVKVNEIVLLVASLVWFLFITTNVNPALGQVYIGFTIGAILLYTLDTKRTIELDRDGLWGKALFISGIIYAIFIIFSSVAVSILEKVDVGGLIGLLGSTTPALANSVILNIITFSFFVSFVETNFWVRIMDFFATRFNIRTDKLFSFGAIVLISVLSFIFLLFHITAKGISNNAALMLVFIMMMVSLGMVFWFKESKQSILFHIISNSVASFYLFGGKIF